MPIQNQPPAGLKPFDQDANAKQGIGGTLWLSTRYGQLLRTTDMGLTWTATANASGAVFENELRGLRFCETIVGSVRVNHIQRTSDGGLTWTEISYTGNPGTTSVTAIAGRPGTYPAYSYTNPANSGLPKGTTTVSYDWGDSWQTLDTAIVSGVMEKLVSLYPGQLRAALQGNDYGTNISPVPMVLRYAGPLLGTKKSGNPALALAAYPSPTTGLVRLQGALQGQEAVQVYGAAGRQCQATTVSSTQPTIDLSSQPAGLHQLRVTSTTGQTRQLRVSKTQ